MKKIPLTQNQFALVADEHYEWLLQRHAWEKSQKPVKWRAWWSPYTKSFYAGRTIYLPNGKRTTEYMHRRILGLKWGDKRQGDHVNHDTLDNQPKNIRITTCRGNHENQRNQSKHGIGIEFNSRCKKRSFQARALFDGQRYHLEYFATAEKAQSARKAWLLAHGEK